METNNRKLVILLDGTSNDKDDEDENSHPSNVAKFNEAIIEDEHTIVKYDSGPGTLRNTIILGGLGAKSVLEEHLREAYEWITQRMHDEESAACLYIFGFSRGAYMARVLSWILHFCGIPENANDCKKRISLFCEKKFDELSELKKTGSVKLPENFIKFLGVWDTVKASDWPDINDEVLSTLVVEACHAMSLDEHRKDFPILKFEKNPKVEQVWFAGVHADVGGGYKESDLSDIACKWMATKAYGCGLHFKRDYMEKLNPNPLSTNVHDEYPNGFWHLRGEKNRPFSDEAIHTSVIERIAGNINYTPRADGFHA